LILPDSGTVGAKHHVLMLFTVNDICDIDQNPRYRNLMHGLNPFTNKYQLSGQNYVVLCQLLKSQTHHLMFYSHDINCLSVMLLKISDAEKNMVLLLLYYDTRECCNEEDCLVFSDPEFCHRVGMQDIHFRTLLSRNSVPAYLNNY